MGPFLVFFRASRYNNFWEFTINKDVYKQSMCRGLVDGVSMDGLSDESAHGCGSTDDVSAIRQDDLLPQAQPGQRAVDRPQYPWAYTEGLTIDEAANELTLLATGIYGHELPDVHGAPIRLVVPWKYGFKEVKSIVSMEFVEDKPKTFWNQLQPNEYAFFSNVKPDSPHQRWSQATECFSEDDHTTIRDTLGYSDGQRVW